MTSLSSNARNDGEFVTNVAERCASKSVETFPLARDPLTGERLEPVYRAAIPVYDAVTGELREFLP